MTTDATDTPPAGQPLGLSLHDHLGPLPPADPRRALHYDAIRYVSGYPESYLQEYARAYAAAQVSAERARRVELEAALREVHDRASWHTDDDADASNESPDDMIAHTNGLIRRICAKVLGRNVRGNVDPTAREE